MGNASRARGLIRFVAKALRHASKRLDGIGVPTDRVPVKIVERDGNWVVAQIGESVWRLDTTQYLDGQLLETGLFEPASTRWVRNQIKPGMVIADVGANFGYYTLLLSRLAGAQGRVLAFEPSSGFRARLERHVRENGCENVSISDQALSDASGTGELYVGGSTGSFLALEGRTPQTVGRITFDSFVKERGLTRLDFVKVDIDGHEPKFIAGAAESLRRFKPTLLMEFSHLHLLLSGSGAEELAKQLTDLGYVLCSERTGQRFPDRVEFLKEAVNCTHSVNVFCYPSSRAP